MAVTGWGTGNNLRAMQALWPGARPFMQSIWFFVPTGTTPTDASMWSLGIDASAEHHRHLIWHSSGGIGALERDLGTNGAITATAWSLDTWHHVAAAYVSGVLREVWLDGAGKGTNTTNRNPNAPDDTLVGRRQGGVPDPTPSTVGLASLSNWGVNGFTATDRDDLAAELASGANPLAVTTDNTGPWFNRLADVGGQPVYAELTDTTDLGPHYSIVGSLSNFGSHPPVDPVPVAGGLLLVRYHLG